MKTTIPCLNDEFLRTLGWSVVMTLFRMEQMRHDSLNGHLYYTPEEERDLGLRLLAYMNGGKDHTSEQKERLLQEVFGGRQGMAALVNALEEISQ